MATLDDNSVVFYASLMAVEGIEEGGKGIDCIIMLEKVCVIFDRFVFQKNAEGY